MEKQAPKKTRILYVNTEAGISGAEKSMLLLVRFIPDIVQVTAACPHGSLSNKLKELKVETYRILSPPRNVLNQTIIWFWYILLINLQLTAIVFRTKPHIIH